MVKDILSYDNSGHIKLPERKQRKNVKALKTARANLRTKKLELAKIDEKMKKMDELEKQMNVATDPKILEKLFNEYKKITQQ